MFLYGAQVQIHSPPFTFDFSDVGLDWEFGRTLVNLALFANSCRDFFCIYGQRTAYAKMVSSTSQLSQIYDSIESDLNCQYQNLTARTVTKQIKMEYSCTVNVVHKKSKR